MYPQEYFSRAAMTGEELSRYGRGKVLEWLDDVGQYYTEYEHQGSTYKIWIEDQNSIEEKLKVYKENDLAGVACWKIGFEKATIWDTISEYIEQ